MTSPIVAVVGGGQLARMMAPAATALGVTLRVLVESEQAAAALPAHQTVVGLPTDPQAVAALISGQPPAVVTWEHEHIPAQVFDTCESHGIPARPGLAALRHAQDKIVMRQAMERLGAPNPAWSTVSDQAAVDAFLAEHGGTAVVKTATGGYDGRGVRVIQSSKEVVDWVADAQQGTGPHLLIEAAVPFTRELAAVVARRPSGDMVAYPVVESRQVEGMCAEVIAPAPDMDPRRQQDVQDLAMSIAESLDVTGVLAVELFEVDGAVVVNELAMRPHNSGHWTIDGAVTSQFEQHIRAVLDLPLGATAAHAPVSVMANVVGGSRQNLADALADVHDPGAKIHLYAKGVRPRRKVGHVTVTGHDVADVHARAVAAARIVADGGAQ